jgi:hypothetical protein
MSRDEKIGAVMLIMIGIELVFLAGMGIGKSIARPGDGYHCERDSTGLCADPEPPRDPCGGKR